MAGYTFQIYSSSSSEGVAGDWNPSESDPSSSTALEAALLSTACLVSLAAAAEGLVSFFVGDSSSSLPSSSSSSSSSEDISGFSGFFEDFGPGLETT